MNFVQLQKVGIEPSPLAKGTKWWNIISTHFVYVEFNINKAEY